MKNQKQPTLYLIGGSARAGKTTALKELMRRRRAITIQSDALRNAIRKVLTGESYVAIQKMRVETETRLHRPGNLKKYTIRRVKNWKGDDDLTWVGTLGLIEAYDRSSKTDVIIEGVAITPQRIRALKLKNLRLKAAFVGYTDASHLETVLAYSAREKDWIQTSIQEHGGDTSHLVKWIRSEMARSRETKKLAKKFGYGYFDITKRDFKKHIAAVVAYLLK